MSRVAARGLTLLAALCVTSHCSFGDEPADPSPLHSAEFVFPFNARHNHAPGIAELADGELIVSWYRGSGERTADDVAVFGARRKAGDNGWGETFLMTDTPGFPDCNTAMMTDAKGQLFLFWPVIIAISDDGGSTWFAGKPLLGFGAIQPSVLRRDNGTLVAYMRENGFTGHVRVAESTDDGITWGAVGISELINPGSGLDGVRLKNGHWILVHNDTQSGRNRLAVSLSADEGQTWTASRHLEDQPKGSFHYPCVIQTTDGLIHCVYSYFCDEGKTMKHAAFNEAWILDDELIVPQQTPRGLEGERQ